MHPAVSEHIGIGSPWHPKLPVMTRTASLSVQDACISMGGHERGKLVLEWGTRRGAAWQRFGARGERMCASQDICYDFTYFFPILFARIRVRWYCSDHARPILRLAQVRFPTQRTYVSTLFNVYLAAGL